MATPLDLRSTPADTTIPSFPASPASSNDQFSSAAEEGYELRTLSHAPTATDEDEDEDNNNENNERGALIPGQECTRRSRRREREDVLYETFQESEEEGEGEGEEGGSMEIRRRERRRGKKEFFYSAAQERAVVRRLDWCLVLFLAVLYMLSFLDRSSAFSSPFSARLELY